MKNFSGYHSQFTLDSSNASTGVQPSSAAAYMYDQSAMAFGTPASYLPHQTYLNAATASQSTTSYGMLATDPFGTRSLNQGDPLLTSVAMMSSSVNPNPPTTTNAETTEKTETSSEKTT